MKASRESKGNHTPLWAGFWQKAGGLLFPSWFPGRDYIPFFRSYPAALTLITLFTFFSSLGQTFLLSFFQADWSESFGLSPAAMGLYYGFATLASGLLLPWMGRQIDLRPLATLTRATALGLFGFSLLTALVWHPWILFICLFGLRFTGQGLSANLSLTVAGKTFERDRGKAIGMAALGFPLGEAVFPLLLVAAIPLLGWRGTWGMLAVLALLLLPLSRALMPHFKTQVPGLAGQAGHEPSPVKRTDLLHDWRFYGLLGAMVPLPFFSTGIIFYQTLLMDERGWAAGHFASGFVLFALVRAIFSFTGGSLVDRFTAKRLVVGQLLLYAAAMLALSVPALPALYLFFVLLGMSFSLAGNVMTAVWVEIYGRDALGTIRGLTSMIGVLSTAVAPIAFGLALGAGWSMGLLVLVALGMTSGIFLPTTLYTSRRLNQA